MWTILGIIGILIGAWLIYTVLVKKFPQLKLIDLTTLARERHAEVKARLIHDRFDRSMQSAHSKTSAWFGGLHDWMHDVYHGLVGRLKRIEKTIDHQKSLEPDEIKTQIGKLLHEAELLIVQDRQDEAEAHYIEVLRLDPKKPEAYRGLADLYISRKLYEQAKETLEFLVHIHADDGHTLEQLGTVDVILGDYAGAETQYLKSITLSTNPAAVRAELGELYLAMREAEKAFEQFQMALEIEPYNPKYLDYFLEASILIGDAKSAVGALEVLETANPENQKLEEFRERILALHQPSDM